MATLHQRRQAVWKRTDRRAVADQRALADRIGLMFMRAASATNEAGDRAIPPARTELAKLSKAIWGLVLKPYFIGPGDEPLDGPMPQSPFADLVVDGIIEAVELEAQQQAKLTRQVLRTAAPDLAAFLIDGKELEAENLFELTVGPSFTPDDYRDPKTGKIDPAAARRAFVRPRGTYDPFHKFVDSGGYRLSDRVWRSGLGERSAIDRFMDYHVSRGTSAVEMAKTLEVYLTGGAAAAKTPKPYGTNGSYAARRLARTEITAAGGRSTIAMSEANPFVGGVRWVLSASHKEIDDCDQNARGGPNGDGIYAPADVPRYPNHPHDLCTLSPQAAANIDDVVKDIRKRVRRARNEFTNVITGGTAASPEVRKLKRLLNPKQLAEAALSGTLDQTIADIAGKYRKAKVPTLRAAAAFRPRAQKPVDTKAEVRIQFLKNKIQQLDEDILLAKAVGDRKKVLSLQSSKSRFKKQLRELEAGVTAPPPAPKPVPVPKPKPAPKPKPVDPQVIKLQDKMADLYVKLDAAKASGDKKKIASVQSSLSVTRRKLRALGVEPLKPGEKPGIAPTPEPTQPPLGIPPTPAPKPIPKGRTVADIKRSLGKLEEELIRLEGLQRGAGGGDPIKVQLARINTMRSVRNDINKLRKKLGYEPVAGIFRPEDTPYSPVIFRQAPPQPEAKPVAVPPPRGKPGEWSDSITIEYQELIKKGEQRVARSKGSKSAKLHQKVVDLNQQLLDQRVAALEKFQGQIPLGYLHDVFPDVKVGKRLTKKMSTKQKADAATVKFMSTSEDSFNEIEKVHKIHADMGNVIFRPVEGTTSEGSYQPGTRVIKLKVQSARPRGRTTVWHEYGHALDDQMLGFSGWGQSGANTLASRYETQSPLAKRALTKLRDVIYDDQRVKDWKTSVSSGKFGKKTVSASYMEYIASDEEIFARGYAQYVAEKLGDTKALGALLSDGKKRQWGYGQWTDAGEFSKIFDAFDELFAAMGMNIE